MIGNDFLLFKLLCANVGPGFVAAMERVQITYNPNHGLSPMSFHWPALTNLQRLTVILEPMAKECDPKSIAHSQTMERQADDPGWTEAVERFLSFTKSLRAVVSAWTSPSGAAVLRRLGGWDSTAAPEFYIQKRKVESYLPKNKPVSLSTFASDCKHHSNAQYQSSTVRSYDITGDPLDDDF